MKNINHDDDDDDDEMMMMMMVVVVVVVVVVEEAVAVAACTGVKNTLPFAVPLASGPKRKCWKERIIRVGTKLFKLSKQNTN